MEGINVLTVTYGTRWNYLEELLKRLEIDTNVLKIFIIDNGSSYDVQAEITKHRISKCLVKRLDVNYGSAIGFSNGLSWFLKEGDSEYLWIIDDDNLPEEDALRELLNQQKKIEVDTKKFEYAFLSLRNDKQYLKLI